MPPHPRTDQPAASLDAGIRPARLPDIPAIRELITGFAAKGQMLERSTDALYDRMREFLVIEDVNGRIGGCAAIHIYTESVAELRSLAVVVEVQGRGYGRRLVEGCVSEAQSWGLRCLICLTYQVDFFSRLGFVRVDRSRFPAKVWSDCVRCPSFLDCREVAMWRQLPRRAGA